VPESKYIHVNGINLHYLDWGGAGQSVVCVHGITGQAHAWDEVASALSPRYHVYAVDLRGHGDSEKPAIGYRIAEYTADIDAFVDALHIAPFILIGHSLGGRIGAIYAGLHPEKLSKAILEDPAFPMEASAASPGHDVAASQKARPASFASLDDAVAYMGNETDLGGKITYAQGWPPEKLRARAVAALRQRPDGQWEYKANPAAMMQTLELIQADGNAGIKANAPKATCPILVIRGAESTVVLPADASALQQLFPNCQVVTVAGVSHGIHTWKFPEFMVALEEFLK
jgi:pimeloyl-ACP methyl ester carboxylesterase